MLRTPSTQTSKKVKHFIKHVSTQSIRTQKHAKHTSTQARKTRKHAKHRSTQARKHVSAPSTDLSDSFKEYHRLGAVKKFFFSKIFFSIELFLHIKTFFSANNLYKYFVKNTNIFSKKFLFFFNLVLLQMNNHRTIPTIPDIPTEQRCFISSRNKETGTEADTKWSCS